jgi:uncharacterized protein YcbK (DUF882 family)
MGLPDSKHFKVSEMTCKDGTPYPEDWKDQWTDLAFETADPVRDAYGFPLEVISGYRTQSYNDDLIKKDEAVGNHNVASSSQHIKGEAMDLAPTDGPPDVTDRVLALHDMVLAKYQRGELPKLGGLGLYPGWIHIDTMKAPDGHLRRWNTRK